MMKMRLMLIGLVSLTLSACGGVDEVVTSQCPEIAVLATADHWAAGDVTAQMQNAKLSCFIDTQTNQLLADIRITGKVSQTGIELPFFVATLTKQDRITNRLQYKVTVSQNNFRFELPRYAYGTRANVAERPRLVAGFVLSKDQLKANRAAYRARLGIE